MFLLFAGLVIGLAMGIVIARRYVPVQIEYVERKVPKSHVVMEKKELSQRVWDSFLYGMRVADGAHNVRASVRVHEDKRRVRVWTTDVIKLVKFDNGRCEFDEDIEDQAPKRRYQQEEEQTA